MKPAILIWIFFFLQYEFCRGQELYVAEFHMEDVTGNARLIKITNTITVAITVSKTLGNTKVEVHPIWMEYDVTDKCSDMQLGESLNELTENVYINENITASINLTNITYSVEGYSIVLRSSDKVICATILKQGNYSTAAAHFMGDFVSGYVYFRQAVSVNSQTLVVTNLYSNEGISSLKWKITDEVSDCSSVTLSTALKLKMYNPRGATDDSSCTQSSPSSCMAGNFSGKFNDAVIGQFNGGSRRRYIDINLALTDVASKPLIVYKNDGSSFSCAVIKLYKGKNAVAKFSHQGVKGSLTFFQKSPLDTTVVHVELQGLSSIAKGFHIHAWPTPVKKSAQDLCANAVVSGHFNPFDKNASSPLYPKPDTSTDDMYEVGDLSSKYGTLADLPALDSIYRDWNLPMFGKNSIIGRSVVIHKNDSSRWICANIMPQYTVVTAKAVFKYPVIGQISFMQELGETDSETSIFVQLDYNDGRTATQGHQWQINSNPISTDMSISPENCKSTNPLFNPFGDLSQRLPLLNIRAVIGAETSSKQFFTDVTLPLSGIKSIIGRSLVILNIDSTVLSCSNIEELRKVKLFANLASAEIKGTINFTQMSGFGDYETEISHNLSGLKSGYRLQIFELPPNDFNDCTSIGSLFNPLEISDSNVTTDDTFKVGDLTRLSSFQQANTQNLPLYGVTSILRRSLGIVNTNNVVVACSIIDNYLLNTMDQHVTAVSNFTGEVNGTVSMYQTLYSDGSLSDTTIIVDLKNSTGSLSFQHNWHTHLNPVNGDDKTASGRCSSTGPHFDPYKTLTNSVNYETECSKVNPLRCEVGDQAKKLGTYDLGSGRKVFTDVDLPLGGPFSVQGRSIVLHVKDKGVSRLACSDIIPKSLNVVHLTIKTPATLDKKGLAKFYATAIGASGEEIVVEHVLSSGGRTDVNVYFTGLREESLISNFTSLIKDHNNFNKLFPYEPISVSSSYHVPPSLVLITTVFCIFTRL